MYLHSPVLEVGSWWRVDTASGTNTPTTVYAHDGADAIPTALGASGSTVRGNTRDGTGLFWSSAATLYCKELTYQGVPTGTVVTSTGVTPTTPGGPPVDIATISAAVAALPTTYASPRGAWSSVTAYTVNQVVTYNESTYRALASSTNVAPGTDATKWELWGGGGALVESGTWATATHYAVGNVVSEVANGQRYACVSSHTSSGAFATDLAGGKWTTTGVSKGYVDTTISAGAVDATTSVKGVVQLAGDLAGTATSPTVAKVGGVAVTGSPTAGQVPTATGGTAATWQDQDHLGLTPTAVKTANYTAAAGDIVPVDTTSGNVTVTFPTAPADRAVVAVKHVVQGGTNTVTLALGGSDKFNTTTGTTTRTLTILSQALLAQYKSSTAVWYVIADDLPLSGLDTRFDASGAAAAVSATRGAVNGLASLDSSTLVPTAQLGTGTANSTKLLAGDRTWASAVTLAQSGQTPSQAPVTAATAASVGSQAFAARSDHVHPDTHPYALPMDSGTWWRLPFVSVSSSWSGLPGGGTVGFLRFPIGAACLIAAMGIQVNTLQSGGLARLGIYSDNAGAPGTLLKDYGTVATDTTGYKTTGATTALALLPGWVWLAVAMEGTFGAQQFDTLSGPYTYIGAATLGGSSTGYNGSGYAGGGLPGTASTLTSFGPALRTFFPWVQTA